MDEQKKNIQSQDNNVIDLREVFKNLWKRKKLFIWVWIITIFVSAAFILPIPRTYVSELSLAPEMGSEMQGGSLASLAGSFGFNLGDMERNDAFYPELYPDIVSTNQFIVDLFDVRVKSLDGEINTDYYTYMKDFQKSAFYNIPIQWVVGQIRTIFNSSKDDKESNSTINPFMLSKEDYALVETVRGAISCNVDKKTFVITIQVEDQDPLICACMADSIRVRLQNFITDYRTSKARNDMEYYRALTDSAQVAYQRALDAYSHYADTHQNAILQFYLSERDALENEVQLKLQSYTAMNTQYEAAKAKVQERTPAFTVLKASDVPIKATYPRRVLLMILMLFLSTFGTIIYIFKQDIFGQLTHLK